MSDDVVVRELKQEDFGGVRRVNELVQKQYRGTKWDLLSDEEKEKYLVARKAEFGINLQTGYCFVAVRENEVIGFIFAHETLPFPQELYIRYIGIDPKYQGQGVGVSLYEKLFAKAKENGIREITTLINLDNPKSMRLHEKVGFTLRERKEAVLELG